MLLGPVAVAALVVATAGSSFPVADQPSDSVTVADWSSFVTVGDLVGEVVKADDNGFTLRVFWNAPSGKTSGSRSHGHHSTSGRTPQQQAQHMRQMQAQFARMAAQQARSVKEHHQDIPVTFAEAGLIRVKTLPPKINDKGEKVVYTTEELKAAKVPQGAPFYAAERSDLKPGSIVDVIFVRPKSIAADKARLTDLQVKYAIIVGMAANPPAGNSTTKKK